MIILLTRDLSKISSFPNSCGANCMLILVVFKVGWYPDNTLPSSEYHSHLIQEAVFYQTLRIQTNYLFYKGIILFTSMWNIFKTLSIKLQTGNTCNSSHWITLICAVWKKEGLIEKGGDPNMWNKPHAFFLEQLVVGSGQGSHASQGVLQEGQGPLLSAQGNGTVWALEVGGMATKCGGYYGGEGWISC